MIEVKVVNTSTQELPKYETDGSSGLDVRAKNELCNPMYVHAGQRVLIKTGLFVEIPQGYEIQVRPRSGLALKKGITVLNTPGTIDSDYRNEIGVILMNHSGEMFEVHEGDRIAQLVLQKVEKIEWKEVKDLNETERGLGGFGHTGNQ